MIKISKRELNLPRAVIAKLLRIASESKSVVSLGVGEPDFVTPKPILDFASKAVYKSTHYTPTEGLTELREALVKKLRKKNNIKAEIENVVVTTGSQEGLLATLLTTLDPNQEVLLPSPCYVGYIPEVDLVSAKPRFLKLKEEDGFEINPDLIRKSITKKTKALIINTPSNPTGNVLKRSTLEELADIARDKNLLILSDEAYEDLVYEGEHVSIASLNGMEKHVISFYTFSKSYAMCGFRVGYVVGKKDFMKALTKVSHYVTLCPPHLSQLAALKALTISPRYTEQMKDEYDKRRKFIVKRLNEIGLHTVKPNGAFYAFSNISSYSKDSFKFSDNLLKKAKVAVVPGREFGPYGEGYIRFSYATKMNNIKIAMDRLERFLR
ncbi:pyridoxal phosphate-dependent aminotransferase [Candidatus Woesearchaeota archaeon]|nr:pyridoxal phosphate-dependent aminotransferase [Candidatus Woesearchaeota archaeon]